MGELRPYQKDAIANVRMLFKQGRRRVLLVLPTGAGKTRTGAEMAIRAVATGLRVLWLVHRTELGDQGAAAIRSLLTSRGLVGVVAAGSREDDNPHAPIVVASLQTLIARGIYPRADLVIFDEAHHAVAETFLTLLEAHYASAFVVGLTATPQRGDGRALGDAFDGLVVGTTVAKLTADGFLVPCRTISPDERLETGKLAQEPVDAYREHAPGTRAILFAKDIEHAEKYAGEFRMAGIPSAVVHAECSWAERDLAIEAFKTGAIRVLTNVYTLTEGFDVPETETCILARGFSCASTYLQCVGRVLRPAPGKTSATALDLAGIAHDFGVASDERLYSLDGEGIRLRDSVAYCEVCGVLRVPGEVCAECGWNPVHSKQKADVIARKKLEAFKRREGHDDEKRAQELAQMIEWQVRSGYKPTRAFHIYRGRYKAEATGAIKDRALRIVAERRKGAA